MKQSRNSRQKKTMQQGAHVYILTNADRSMLYVGVSSSLSYRVEQHLSKVHPESFTARYDCNKLVYFKHYNNADDAKTEEKRIKALDKAGKDELITSVNAGWEDLFANIELM